MKGLKINGVDFGTVSHIEVEVTVADEGETMCPIHIKVSGGKLDVNKSALTTEGNLSLHPFRQEIPSGNQTVVPEQRASGER